MPVFTSSSHGGDEEDRTPDPLLAKQVLSQLSYTPTSFLKKAWQKLFISDLLQSTFKVHVLSSGSFPHFKLPFKVSSKSNNAEHNVPCLTEVSTLLCCLLLRKEVIQPHLPIRLPCYDFTPVINPTFDCVLLAVRLQASGVTDSHGVTGGVYKARERIHRSMLICDY